MRVIILDGNTITSKAEFWDAYERQTDPDEVEGFGRNLDALNDALWGGPGCPGKCRIVLMNSQKLQETLGAAYYQALIETIGDAEDATLVIEP